MIEKRRDKRLPIHMELKINELYKQDAVSIDDVNEDVVITNISKNGIGFDSKHELPLDFYFNAEITIDNEKHFFSVLKILRKVTEENGRFHYGCEFIGLADLLKGYVDEYQHEIE